VILTSDSGRSVAKSGVSTLNSATHLSRVEAIFIGFNMQTWQPWGQSHDCMVEDVSAEE